MCKVVCIRGMSILMLIWLVLRGLVGEGSNCESILDNVCIIWGLGLLSLLPLDGIESTGFKFV
jgi:hypothetical protein